jgi:hypothetical protein
MMAEDVWNLLNTFESDVRTAKTECDVNRLVDVKTQYRDRAYAIQERLNLADAYESELTHVRVIVSDIIAELEIWSKEMDDYMGEPEIRRRAIADKLRKALGEKVEP